MNLCLFKKVIQILLALVVVNISIFAPVSAQSGNAQSEIDEAQQQLAKDAEAKTPQILLSDLERNERALYELFNALNSSNKNDIVCSTLPDTGLQLCEPVFLEEIRREVHAELAQNSKADTGFFARIRNVFQSPEERAKRQLQEKASAPVELLQKEIATLATVHPNLLAQLNTIGKLQREYMRMVEAERRSTSYFMRQNETSYNHSGFGQSQSDRPRLTLSAPPPGYTQPTLNYGYQGRLAD